MRYREMRLPCDVEVVVMVADQPRRVRVVNVSSTGARVEGLGRVPREAPVTVMHLYSRFPARVVWTNARQAGLRFTIPLSAADLASLRGVGTVRSTFGGFREMT